MQRLLTEALEESVEPDGDGDFMVVGESSAAWVSPDTSIPCGVRVFAYAARGVPVKMATLKEINQINSADPLVKVALSDGILIVSMYVLADAVNAANLLPAISKVLSVADRIGPLLVAVHGGQVAIATSSESVHDD